MATSIIHRKEKIIFRAIDVINESGVQALTTKKIAQMEKIAESTIFKHFSSKTEILLAVVDFYSQYDADIIESINLKKLSGLDAFKYFFDSYIRYYENYPAITAITQGLDEMRYIEALAEKVIEVISVRRSSLDRIILEAQRMKEISQEYDSIAYVDAIMGTINGVIRRWRMENQAFNLYESCHKAVALIIRNKDFNERGGSGEY